jgi:hypothetical protein
MKRLSRISAGSLLPVALAGSLAGASQPPKGFFADVRSTGIGADLHGNPGSCYGQCVSADGRRVFFFLYDKPCGRIYFADRTEGGNFGRSRHLQELASGPDVRLEGLHGCDASCSITDDNRQLFIASSRDGDFDIYLARDVDGDGLFDTVAPVEGPVDGGVNTPGVEWCPAINSDGTALYFVRNEIPGIGRDIYVVERDDSESTFFGEPKRLTCSSWIYDELWPSIAADGSCLFFSDWTSNPPRGDSIDLWVSPAPFETAYDVTVLWPYSEAMDINTPFADGSPFIARQWPQPDAELIFASDRPHDQGGDGSTIYMAKWHPDCNSNGTDDRQDIADGRSTDADGNGVPDECEVVFRRGDGNHDGTVNIADAIYALQNLFAGGPAIPCPDAADANDDERVNIADGVYVLQYIFADGPAPAEPFTACGFDTTSAPAARDPDLPGCMYDSALCPSP